MGLLINQVMAQQVSILETVVVITVKLLVVMEELLMVIQVLLILLVVQVHQLVDLARLEIEDLVVAVEVHNLKLVDQMVVLVKYNIDF